MKKEGKSIDSKVESDAMEKIRSSGPIGYAVDKSNATRLWHRRSYNRVTNFRYGNSPGCTPYDKK